MLYIYPRVDVVAVQHIIDDDVNLLHCVIIVGLIGNMWVNNNSAAAAFVFILPLYHHIHSRLIGALQSNK